MTWEQIYRIVTLIIELFHKAAPLAGPQAGDQDTPKAQTPSVSSEAKPPDPSLN